jgi:hypothetical protein
MRDGVGKMLEVRICRDQSIICCSESPLGLDYLILRAFAVCNVKAISDRSAIT